MEGPSRQQSFRRKKMTKQLTGKRGDKTLHSAARAGNLEVVLELLTINGDEELKELLSEQNQSGETALYVAAEYGYVDLVKEMMKYYDIASAGIKAKNGYDAFHIAAKQGDLEHVVNHIPVLVAQTGTIHVPEILKVLMETHHDLSMTFDQSNTTALHSAAAQGHIEVVNFLLEKNSSLATITRSNGKTALHSSARNGHLEVVKALLRKEPGIALRNDKKGQMALHMAVKGQSVKVVDELIEFNADLITMFDSKGNTPLHIATRKGRAQPNLMAIAEELEMLKKIQSLYKVGTRCGYPRAILQIVQALLNRKGIDKQAINRSGETTLDIAEKMGHSEIAIILQEHGVLNAKSMKSTPTTNTARELKQTVSEIKHEVHDQLKHTRQARRGVQGIAKRLNKMQAEGLNNAINSTTVVAVLIASVAFAAIFVVPGQYASDPTNLPPGFSLGEANVAPKAPFILFFIFDSLALFISLAVVVFQTSVVVVDRKAKKQMMSVINKLMWLACVLLSAAFLSLSFIVVGNERWLAIGVTVIGTVIMSTTLGTMCYWVIMHRIEASNLRSIHRSSRSSRSLSLSMSAMSDTEILSNDYKKLYAI
ncbi:hypothetical protein TEA_010080 [Camellia sinensis var. sinensis]|uniref:PGG domain-containing protein n=1 Tax=Camellia sinensis var. sinensis TaxID=542762 RepID=A0A4S4DL84_CAMSN|nr:hypothetical protein TEA_010080 [Camellia sinensis var. sinensis]